jgi:hypothetical protein
MRLGNMTLGIARSATMSRRVQYASWIILSMLIAASLPGCAQKSSGAQHRLVRPSSSQTGYDLARIAEVANAHANFSVDQHLAVVQEVQRQRLNLTSRNSVSRAARQARLPFQETLGASGASTPQSPANFRGNFTLVGSQNSLVALQRQTDCSLTLATGSYSFMSPASMQITQLTAHYDQVLHSEAALTTTAGNFLNHCADPTTGLGSSEGAYLGKTSGGSALFAGVGATSISSGTNSLFAIPMSLSSTSTQTAGSYFVDGSENYSVFAAGDLTGDGLADVVALDYASASIHVFMANASGTLGTPTTIGLPGAGNLGEAVVIADLNGDGKQDVAVATIDTSTAPQQEYLTVLLGNGNGTFATPQTQAITTPTLVDGSNPGAPATIQNIIAADLHSSSKLDLVGSNGALLFNDGTAHFTAAPAPAFAASLPQYYSPNLVAADFDKDGKLDLAVDTGYDITIYKGSGTGTFTLTNTYSNINSEGYLTATDLDGDGNVDLWVGIARAGIFGGDQSNTQGYALMGNGDDSFQGTDVLPFGFSGGNIADLNGDGIPDAVGVNADLSITPYIGDGKGHFTAHSSVTSPTSYMGTPDTITNIDSIELADVNGDGKPDLLYIPTGGLYFNGENGTAGLFIALNDGQGGFNPPVFYAVASTLPTGHLDRYWSISNLHVADVNHDGNGDLIYNYQDTDTTTNRTNYGTAVQLGNGDGTFGPANDIPFYSEPFNTGMGGRQSYVAVIADLNKDGNPDLIFEASTGTTDSELSAPVMQLQVALGHGDGTFATATAVAGPDIIARAIYATSMPPSVAVADMNGDGVPDLIVQGSSSAYDAQIAIALGNGDGTFKAPSLLTYGAQYLNIEQGIAVGDFNGDGKADVFVDSPFDPSFDGIFTGNGDGTLRYVTNADSAIVPNLAIYPLVYEAAVTIDLNHDGHNAILAGNTLLIPQASSIVTGTAASTVSLVAAPTSVSAGQAVSLTATVAGSAGTPTGTVAFLDGSSAIGSASIGAQGTASLSVSTLASGSHSIAASFSGDSTYAASTSAEVSVTVSGATFALSMSPASASVAAGSSATTTVTVTPTGGFSGSVALTCSGLPAGAGCSFSPSSVTVNGAGATSTLTISSATRSARQGFPRRPTDPMGPTGVLLAGILVPASLRGRRRSRGGRTRDLLVAGLMCAAILQGCGGGHDNATGPGGGGSGGGGTPSGTYTVTVTGTAGSTTQSTVYMLTIR